MKIERFRKFNTRDVYPGGKHDNDMCMTVKAGNRIFLRGQTGLDLNQKLIDPVNAGEQARQAMENAKILLEEAGSSLDHVTMVTTYLTDPAYREDVYKVVAEYLRGNHTVGTGLIVRGLALPDLKVEIDLEAVIPATGEFKKYKLMNSKDWYGQGAINRDSAWLIDTGEEVFLRGQTGTEFDGKTMHGTGYTVEDAGKQAEQAMRNTQELFEEAGLSFDDVCRTRIYLADRAYREPVYQAIGKHFGETYPCSTGLIMDGFARPEILFEIDMFITKTNGTPHQRFHKFHTDDMYTDGQNLGMRFCKIVKAGNRVYLRGQTGSTLDGKFNTLGDPAAQAHQAMENIETLLAEAGASMNDVCKISTYILHRGHREAIYRAIGEHVKGVHPCGTGLIVNGFAKPHLLVEIDVEAVIQD